MNEVNDELNVYRTRIEDKGKDKEIILVVDDSDDERHFLKALLTKHGYEVITASNGIDAMQQVQTAKPDLVLLDLVMPYMDGMATCRAFKANYETTTTPIIIISHRETTDDIVNAFMAGADDYVVKPCRWPELLARIKANVRRTTREITANPLTRIPGINFLYHQVKLRLESDDFFALGICDIDNFKAYNDRYGFEAGDQIIQLLANILKKHISSADPANCLVHLGGDDFIFLSRIEQVKAICENIIREFDTEAPKHYNEEDRQHGYIQAVNRRGSIEFFPIMTISIGLTSNELRRYTKLAELAEDANEVKLFLKKTTVSSFMMNRRP